MVRFGVVVLVLLGAATLGGDSAPAAASPSPCSGESVIIEVPGPRGFVTSDEWCARLAGR